MIRYVQAGYATVVDTQHIPRLSLPQKEAEIVVRGIHRDLDCRTSDHTQARFNDRIPGCIVHGTNRKMRHNYTYSFLSNTCLFRSSFQGRMLPAERLHRTTVFTKEAPGFVFTIRNGLEPTGNAGQTDALFTYNFSQSRKAFLPYSIISKRFANSIRNAFAFANTKSPMDTFVSAGRLGSVNASARLKQFCWLNDDPPIFSVFSAGRSRRQQRNRGIPPSRRLLKKTKVLASKWMVASLGHLWTRTTPCPLLSLQLFSFTTNLSRFGQS